VPRRPGLYCQPQLSRSCGRRSERRAGGRRPAFPPV
jgi:hypothetical protein